MNDFPLLTKAKSDPHWRNTVFLLKPTAGSGTTSFVDDSLYLHSLTRVGNVVKYNDNMFPPSGKVIYFDGNGDRLYATNSLFALGTSDFTIDFWVMLLNGGAAYSRIVAIGPNATLGSIFINKNNLNPGFLVELGTSGGYEGVCNNDNALPFGTWNHFALVREESNFNRWRAYVNGVYIAGNTGLAGKNITADTITIGGNTSNSESLMGFLSEIRITKAVRYRNNFTPERFSLTA